MHSYEQPGVILLVSRWCHLQIVFSTRTWDQQQHSEQLSPPRVGLIELTEIFMSQKSDYIRTYVDLCWPLGGIGRSYVLIVVTNRLWSKWRTQIFSTLFNLSCYILIYDSFLPGFVLKGRGMYPAGLFFLFLLYVLRIFCCVIFF